MTYNLVEPAARLTDACGDGTLMCPICGEGYLHPGKVTELKDGGAYIAFSCEHCSLHELSLADTIGSLRILHHKGNTHLSWEVNPAFMNSERVREHEKLINQYYDVLGKLHALRAEAKPKTPIEQLRDAVRGWDE